MTHSREIKSSDFERVNECRKAVDAAKIQAIGWMYAEACILQELGKDIRNADVSKILERAKKDLNFFDSSIGD